MVSARYRLILQAAFLTISLVLATCLSGLSARAQTSETAAAGTASAETAASAAKAPAQALVEILQDDKARAALIDELARVAAASDPAREVPGAAEKIADAPAEQVSLGRRLAMVTQRAAQRVADQAVSLWGAISAAPEAFSGLQGDEVGVLGGALTELFLAIVITVVVFVLLRRLAIPLYRRMGARADRAGWMRTVLIFLASGAIDVIVVAVAWAIGYAAVVSFLGDFGEIGIRQTLYLNAFLAVELVKVAIRMVLSPSTGGLRPLPLSDGAARFLASRANLVVGVLGYGFLLVVPILNQSVSYAAGRSTSALLVVLVILSVAVMVIRKRKAVSDWILTELTAAPRKDAALLPEGEELEPPKPRGAVAALAQNWHWLALAYLAVLLVVATSRPAEVVFSVLAASGKIALVLILGIVLSGMLARAVARGIRLPDELNAKLPLLERRLNQFVPKTLLVIRLLLLVVVAALVIDILGGFDLRLWLAGDLGTRVSGAFVGVFLCLVVAFAIWLAVTSWIDFRLNPEYGTAPSAREKTLLTLLKNAFTIALLILTLMFVLSEIGLNIGPLLASAGVLGLAIGFGAQKMVQDIITGVFIQFENAMNVGDVVTVGGTTGTVEKLTVRSVSLRALDGVFHIIPFSSVDMVSNYMRDFSYHVADMGIAYREDYEEAKQAMFDAFDELKEDPEQAVNLLSDLEWFGLNSFGDSAVVVRGRIKTLPGKQWGVGRAYNQVLKKIFDARGIEIPFPHQTIYFGEGKDGRTQQLRLAESTETAPGSGPGTVEGEAREVDPDRGRIDPRTTDAPHDSDADGVEDSAER